MGKQITGEDKPGTISIRQLQLLANWQSIKFNIYIPEKHSSYRSLVEISQPNNENLLIEINMVS